MQVRGLQESCNIRFFLYKNQSQQQIMFEPSTILSSICQTIDTYLSKEKSICLSTFRAAQQGAGQQGYGPGGVAVPHRP